MRAPRWWSRYVPSVSAPPWLLRAADVLADGSISLLTRWVRRTALWVRDGRAPAPGEERQPRRPATRWLRGAAVVVLVCLAVRLGDRLLRAHPRLTAVLVAVWCVMAWREGRAIGPRKPVAPAAATAPLRHEVDAERPELPADAFVYVVTEMLGPEEFARILHRLTGTAQGVHLASVLEYLQQAHPGHPWEGPDRTQKYAAVRALAAAAGATVTGAVRVRGQGVAVGIRARDLPPLPAPAPTPSTDPVDGVVFASQSSSTVRPTVVPTPRSATPLTPAWRPGEGPVVVVPEFVVEDDPTNDRRALVTWSS